LRDLSPSKSVPGQKAERLAASIFRPDYPQKADIVDALWHFRFVP
jgi:hypothetical protein